MGCLMERLLDYIKNNVCWEMGAISPEMWEKWTIPGKYYFSIFVSSEHQAVSRGKHGYGKTVLEAFDNCLSSPDIDED